MATDPGRKVQEAATAAETVLDEEAKAASTSNPEVDAPGWFGGRSKVSRDLTLEQCFEIIDELNPYVRSGLTSANVAENVVSTDPGRMLRVVRMLGETDDNSFVIYGAFISALEDSNMRELLNVASELGLLV